MHTSTLFSLIAAACTATSVATAAPTPAAPSAQSPFQANLLVTDYPRREEVFFAAARNADPLKFENVNGKYPVLDNNKVGVKAVHSPSITVDPTKNKYFVFGSNTSMLALSYSGAAAYNQGNGDLIVWEAEDETLAKWSEPRAMNVGGKDSLHTFNPKSIWDASKGKHFVYWSGALKSDPVSRIYSCYTDDFKTCDAPVKYFDETGKNTTHMQIFALGDAIHFLRVYTNGQNTVKVQVGNGGLHGAFTTIGRWHSRSTPSNADPSLMDDSASPVIFNLNDNPKKFYAIFNKKGNYQTLKYKDIEIFPKSKDEVKGWPQGVVEGTVLPIKQSQYDAIMKAAWPQSQ